jgi:outer membrane protein assembly factor BamD (BamD/ComL family)
MGMSILMKIHPREWNKDLSLLPTKALKNNENDRQNQLRIVKELFSQFPRAYHYFSNVVHEYPDSLWVNDAMDKMKTIEDRTKQYLKIIESFSK